MSKGTISTKLAVGFGAVTLLLVLISAFAVYEIRAVNDGCKEIGTNWMPAIGNASAMNTDTSNYRLATAEHIIAETADRKKGSEDALAASEKSAAKNRAEYFVASEKERQITSDFDRHWAQYRELNIKIIALSNEGKKRKPLHSMKVAASTSLRKWTHSRTNWWK